MSVRFVAHVYRCGLVGLIGRHAAVGEASFRFAFSRARWATGASRGVCMGHGEARARSARAAHRVLFCTDVALDRMKLGFHSVIRAASGRGTG